MKKKLITLLMAFALIFSNVAIVSAADTIGDPPEMNIPTATGAEALSAIADTANSVVIDLRSAEDYAAAHIKGSISLPVCLSASENYAVNTDLKAAFVNYVNSNPDLSGKKIYLVCYVGTFCVNHAANWLVNDCSISDTNLYRVTGGVWDDADLAANLKYTSADYALDAAKAGAIILDVRATDTYLNGYVDKSLHHPLFEGTTVSNGEDDALAKDFAAYVEANKALLSSKNIYILCNSGSRGAEAATKVLNKAGISKNVFTIDGGANYNPSIQNVFVKNSTVTGTQAVESIDKDGYVIIDVRTKANYDKGHLKTSISMPLFGASVTNGYDALAQAFLASVNANSAKLAGKDIYILCNSGSKGAQAATKLLMQAGYSSSDIFTITGGAKGTDTDKSAPNALTYVSADQAISVIGNKDYVIVDVRTAENYAKGHLEGSVSIPLFDAKGVTNGSDALATAFAAYVKANPSVFANKTIYVLCNSGARGAQAAIKLLAAAGYKNVFTIEGGANLNPSIQAKFVTTAPKTGDAATSMMYVMLMVVALGAVVVAGKKRYTK